MYEFGSKEREMEQQLATILFWAKDHEEHRRTANARPKIVKANEE